MGKKKKGGDSKGKKAHKNKPTSKKYKFYTIEGTSVKRKQHCPRCGPGVFLADRKDRKHCGKCGYTEFVGKADKVAVK
ncbi:30S ribosomal protein S27ae [Candidatus Pacearchaeota archaeon CG_4_9_14_0_2_um_filter_39_13]|nr:30S ribosomal protein S27ae [Candidatus Pacearchaeota archaeon]PJC44822.1 MAG: 30S ribosomal protein S27ae [Candidatus Pacearchaeota archaeon CG_4_9_14_0_2_um_filter_39_13]